MKLLWILAWTCWPPSKYPVPTYEVYDSSKSALNAVTNGNHSTCKWEVYEASATVMVGSK